MGAAPDTIPGTPDHPYWQFIRRLYFYDPVPTLRQLQVPTLALWGELDNNILAGQEQGRLGGRAQGRREPGLHADRSCRRRTMLSGRRRSEATRKRSHCSDSCRLLHDHPGLAREAHPRFRNAAVVAKGPLPPQRNQADRPSWPGVPESNTPRDRPGRLSPRQR